MMLYNSELAMVFLPPVLYWTISTFFYILSSLKLTSVEHHRIPTDQKMRPANRVTERKVIIQVLIQHAIQCVAAGALAVLSRPADILTRSVESPPLILLKLVLGALILDTYQYWWHRFMHENKWLYRNLHAVHHQLTVPYAFGALYNHIAEGFIMDTVGGGLPAMILDMHPWTATLFFCIATAKTVDDHCGYSFKWDPFQMLFPNNAAYHDIHHWGKGRMYNYSQPFFIFWDQWMGTHYETEMRKKALKKLEMKAKLSSDERAHEASDTDTLVNSPTKESLITPQSSGERSLGQGSVKNIVRADSKISL